MGEEEPLVLEAPNGQRSRQTVELSSRKMTQTFFDCALGRKRPDRSCPVWSSCCARSRPDARSLTSSLGGVHLYQMPNAEAGFDASPDDRH